MNGKRMLAGLLIAAMVITGVAFVPNIAKAADSIAWEELSIKEYWSAETKKVPTKDGYIFGGWYVEQNDEGFLTETTAAAAVEGSQKVYAKFVSNEVMTIKAQNRENTTSESTSTNVRLISAVDSLKYQEVGFEILINKKNLVSGTNSTKVFEQIWNGESYDTANNHFGAAAAYFNIWRLDDIANQYFGKAIYARPYWKTMDGTVVEGLAKLVHVEDEYNNYVTVPINIVDGDAVAAGIIDATYNKEVFDFVDFESGILFEEMYANPKVDAVKIVGNASTVDKDEVANELFGQIRLSVKSGQDKTNQVITMTKGKFCNWQEAEVTNIKVLNITIK